jgi:hypothetical protein
VDNELKFKRHRRIFLIFSCGMYRQPDHHSRSTAGIAGSNPDVIVKVCLAFVLCGYRPQRRADHSSRGVLPNVCVSLCAIKCNNNSPHLQWDRWKEIRLKIKCTDN